MKTVERSGN